MSQQLRCDAPTDSLYGNSQELRVELEALCQSSEDLREYSMILLSEAQELCRKSRRIRRFNSYLNEINPSPNSRENRVRHKERLMD